MLKESESYRKLAEFFSLQGRACKQRASTEKLLELLDKDLSVGFPYGNAVAGEKSDRGALRCQVWAEKVTRMLQSLLVRYQAEGEKMLEGTGVYVCTICGFVFVGDEPPANVSGMQGARRGSLKRSKGAK